MPFFVVDRPMSLNIIKSFFVKYPNVRFGLMTNIATSKNFSRLYAEFPCERDGCWLLEEKEHCDSNKLCEKANLIRKNVVKAVDCGIFMDGKRPAYPRLFQLYNEMKPDYAVMKDFLGDARRTLKSAKQAIRFHKQEEHNFDLILVSQGKAIDEYVRSCNSLKELGYGRLAIGGLLNIKKNSARYSSAGTMERIEEVLASVREIIPDDWLFVLGCYHPLRHRMFEKYDIFGSDYKGWIFHYSHRLDSLAAMNERLLVFERERPHLKATTRKAEKRSILMRKIDELRYLYATTKNISEEASQRKSDVLRELKLELKKLAEIDQQLLRLRMDAASKDHLPPMYKDILLGYKRLLSLSDQDHRVEEVHAYLKNEILPLQYNKG